MKTLIVIPARYASSRFPGKPLAVLTGSTGNTKTLIERSWNAAMEVTGVDRVVVATDDDRIKSTCEVFGAEVVMTAESCGNGTERCADALSNLGETYDIIVNLQGDAPLTPAWFVEDLITALAADESAGVATPVLRCDGRALNGFLADRRDGRVGGTTAVFAANSHALYFSKEVIPFTSETYSNNAPTPVFHHVGVYAFRPDALTSYPGWNIGPLEQLEGLEQLRFMENGHSVLCVEVEAKGRQFWELNNPEDTPRIEQMMREMGVE
jgi:3-deoxy-manno-octulosonate cytidylyltransferase (CMP-KDO synthetase)